MRRDPKRPDVEVEHPAVAPTTASSHSQRVVRRFPRPIPIRVRVEHGFQDRLQVALDDHLGDAVGNRRYAQRSGSATITFRDVDAPHWRRKVAAGTHPVPDPIEVLIQIPVEIFDGLSVNSGRPLVGLHLLVRFPHIALGNTKRLGFIHAGHPHSGCRPHKAG